MEAGQTRLFPRIVHDISRVLNYIGFVVLSAMVLLVTVDVFLRYFFNAPVTGSYELTELMMSVLIAFALAYTAVQKGHIRIDVLLERFPVKVQAYINCITSLICFFMLALFAWRSILYGNNLQFAKDTTASLHVPVFPFVYMVALGCALMALVYLVDLSECWASFIKATRRWVAGVLSAAAVVVLLAIILLLFTSGASDKLNPITVGVMGLIAMIILLFSGMHISIVMALVGFLGMVYVNGLAPGLSVLGTTPYSTLANYNFSVMPLFVLMGAFCFSSGLSKDLYATAYKWIGHLPGGLAMATIGACAGFACVSGSTLATTATMAQTALPEMKKFKYNPALATGCIAAGGGIGILIPPSTILVLYGILAEQSIGKLLLAGFLPGILQAIIYITTIFIVCKIHPDWGPPGAKSSMKERIVSLKGIWAVLLLFIIVIGGIYSGVFTPTEAAGIGAFGSFLFVLFRKQLTWKTLKKCFEETSITTALTFFILIGADIFGYFLVSTRTTFALSSFVASLAVDRYVILSIIIMVYIFLGCILSTIAMIVLTVPIFLPLLITLGFDPIWFGVVIVVLVEMGTITPPVGINVFIMHGIAKDVPMYTIFRGIVPFIYANLFNILILVLFPQIATFLPNLMK